MPPQFSGRIDAVQKSARLARESKAETYIRPEETSVSGAVYTTGPVEKIICDVFGDYCSQALSVAACESGYNVDAVNGQYLGIFQMGESERATYGHGPDARSQARAAWAYFAASGYDWSPWACKP